MNYKLCALALTSLVLAINAFPQQEKEDLPTCDRAGAIRSTVQCWLGTDTGLWFADTVLGAKSSLEKANWEEFVDVAFEQKNMSLAASKLFDDAGGAEPVGLGLILAFDDAVYSDENVEIRAKMCGALQGLLSCASENARECFPRLNAMVKQLGGTLGMPQLLKAATVQNALKLVSQSLCVLCDNEANGLKTVLSVVIDENQKKELKTMMGPQFRLDAYNSCPAKNNAALSTNDDYRNLLSESPCDFLPYARCLTNDIHEKLNPDEPNNYLQQLGELFFAEVFQCSSAEAPDSAKCDAHEKLQNTLERSSAALQTGEDNTTSSASYQSASFLIILSALIKQFIRL